MINFEDVEVFDCIYKKNLEYAKEETWARDAAAHRWESDCHKMAVQWTVEDVENLVSKYLDEKYGK
jgi:hypothetical protein